MNFYSQEELSDLGFSSVGKNVFISRNAKFYNPQNISLGNNIRIDDFCVLSAGSSIQIEDYVHVAVGCTLIGKGKILLSNFCGLSSRVSIYSSNDDYTGEALTGPMVSDEYKKVITGNVILKKHVIVGSGSVILPNVTLEQGVAVGALSIIRKSCKSFEIYSGNPAKFIRHRSTNILELEKKFLENIICSEVI